MVYSLSQQQVLHTSAVMHAAQYQLQHAQQHGNYVTGQPGTLGRNPVAQRIQDAFEVGARGGPGVGAALHSAANAPAPLRSSVPSLPPAQEAKAPGCLQSLFESCSNILGCRMETLDD